MRAEIRAATRNCKCSSSCFEKLSLSDIYNHVLQLRELDKGQKEMYLMELLDSAHWNRRTAKPDRKRRRHCYTALGVSVCQKAIILCHGLDKKQLMNIQQHFSQNGIATSRHGSANRKPKHALTVEQTRPVVTLITNYATEHRLLMLAAPRGRGSIPQTLLPAGQTKRSVYDLYKVSYDSADAPALGLAIFKVDSISIVLFTLLIKLIRLVWGQLSFPVH